MNALATNAGETGGFTADGDRWRFDGTLTFYDATTALESSKRMALPASGVVDMAGLTHADSSALAVLLALQRRATVEKRTLVFPALPPMLDSLARVYGIEELFAR